MDEELLKRNTDCVYFLASPLTCKKGIACEYRHSEIARLNPRDCWYWLSGNCLNPSCGFRHPPLDVPTEAPAEFAPLSYQSSVPVEKTNVPCYFYFNGFCNKGDRCSFLHGPDGSTPAKPLKTASATTEALPLENKISVGNDRGSTPTETHPKPLNPSETTRKAEVEIEFQAEDDLQKPAPKTIPQRSTSPQIMFECEDPLVKPDSLIPAEGSTQSRSNLLSDQSSEEHVDDDHVEPEERWESSPGFDVLVDDKSENLAYEDDSDYLLAHDREGRELNNHFMGYDYEDPDEYNPAYPDVDLVYDREMYDRYDRIENEDIFGKVGRIPSHSRERMLDSLLPRKRKLLPMEPAVNDRYDLDLRDHLLKRRVIDGHTVSRSSRRHDSSCLNARSPERPRRHGMGRRLHGRLTSEMTKNTIDSFREYGNLSNGAILHGKGRLSQQNRSRQHYRDKRPRKREVLSSEVSRKSVSRERRSTQESATFTGPKTLAQILEEKSKVKGNEDCYMNRTSSANFQGPKPLSEILEEKKKLGNGRDGNSSSS